MKAPLVSLLSDAILKAMGMSFSGSYLFCVAQCGYAVGLYLGMSPFQVDLSSIAMNNVCVANHNMPTTISKTHKMRVQIHYRQITTINGNPLSQIDMSFKRCNDSVCAFPCLMLSPRLTRGGYRYTKDT